MRRPTILAAIAATLGACTVEQGAPLPEPPPTPAASRPPPPISGGTLLVAADGKTAVAADPDRDRILVADLNTKSLLAEVKLEPLDEPGRVVEGPPGLVNVALRRGGAVVTIDIATKQIVRRTPACPAPRGLAYDGNGSLHIACAGGELVTLSTESGAEVRRLHLEPDLRDIIVQPDGLLVSVFRAAKVLRIDAQGAIVAERGLPTPEFSGLTPAVAWRMVPLADGGAAIVHQRGSLNLINTMPGGYSEDPGCGGDIVQTAVSFLDPTLETDGLAGATIDFSALPIDLAVSPNGLTFAVVNAGSDSVFQMPLEPYRLGGVSFGLCSAETATPLSEGQPIAVAFAGSGRVIQMREPSRLVLEDGSMIELLGETVFETGHDLFHRPPTASASMSCASCHPEGRDDGRVWNFMDVGPRRTQSVAGGVLATAPLHWDGALESFDSLMNDVFTQRMGGPAQSPRRIRAIALRVDSVPFLPASPVGDEGAAARGKALFESASVGCATCHSGPRFTNNASYDVGTGGVFQVPSLRGIAARAPFMHDGCAPTLRDRFDPICGGSDAHGVTSNLTPADIDDLVSYLETL